MVSDGGFMHGAMRLSAGHHLGGIGVLGLEEGEEEGR